MALDHTKIHPAIKALLTLAIHFVLGLETYVWFGGIKDITINEDFYWVMILPILVLHLVAIVFVYVVSSVIINYYFKSIGYASRLALIAGCMVFFFLGYYIF